MSPHDSCFIYLYHSAGDGESCALALSLYGDPYQNLGVDPKKNSSRFKKMIANAGTSIRDLKAET